MEYLKCFNKVTPRINITYKCNMFSYCKYCYSKEELKKYPNDMKIKDFLRLIQWFKEAYQIENVVFLGGESISHPEFKKFGEILNSENVGCFLFTNGCFSKEKLEIIKNINAFHTVFLHFEPAFLNNKLLRKKFLKNLEELTKVKKIVFRYNTGDPKFDFSELIELSKKYNASIAYSFTSPTINRDIEYVKLNNLKKYVPQLIKFLEETEKNGIDVLDKRPLPLCIFDQDELNKYLKNGMIRSDCCFGSVCVNPDLSLIASPTLTNIITSPPENKNDLIKKVNLLQNKVDNLKWNTPTILKCKNCSRWKNHECQGGCTVYKVVK